MSPLSIGERRNRPADERPDGRAVRTVRSRRAICEACLDLVEDGVLQPSADQIAERAGVSRRSVFNHFADLAELYDAVGEVGMQRYAPLLEEIPATGSLEQRIGRLISVRSKFLEATAAITRALTAQALMGSAADQAQRVSRRALERHYKDVDRVFAAELSALSEEARTEICEAISAVTSPLQWEYLRRSRGQSIARSRAVIQRTLRSILHDAS